jgi:hypothetical protein
MPTPLKLESGKKVGGYWQTDQPDDPKILLSGFMNNHHKDYVVNNEQGVSTTAGTNDVLLRKRA